MPLIEERADDYTLTDLQQCILSRLAYWDYAKPYSYYKAQGEDGLKLSNVLKREQKEKLKAEFHLDDETLAAVCEWKLAAVYDANDTKGFYAVIIETAPNQATVAFRGSELNGGASQYAYDWMIADFGLLNNQLTLQQEECDQFLEDADVRATLMRYDGLAYAGHSLGGNLAEYAAVATADDPVLLGRLKNVYSLDGPGFSRRFIKEHRRQIAEVSDKIHHVSWSLIGDMLSRLPGTYDNHRYVDTRDSIGKHNPKKHSLSFVSIDENGSFQQVDDLSGWYEDSVTFVSRFFDLGFRTIDVLNPVGTALRGAYFTFIGHLYCVLTGQDELFDTAQRKASKEVSENKDFYLDVQGFYNLADTCGKLIASLQAEADELGAMAESPVVIDGIPDKVRSFPIVRWAVSAVEKLDSAYSTMFSKTARSKNEVEHAITILKGVQSYLSETADEFTDVERQATELMQDWVRDVGI